VDTTDGVVRLSGTVEGEKARSEAVRLAENTDGVVRVVNDIEIGDPTFAQNVNDKAIETKIKAKLTGDPEINPFNIDVDSQRGGEVTLTGTVDDETTKDEAEKIARNTDGVKSVNNRIEVKRDRSAMDVDANADMDDDRVAVDADADWDADRDLDADVDAEVDADVAMTDRYGERREGVTATHRADLAATHTDTDLDARRNADMDGENEKVVATIVRVDGNTLVVDTDSGRREIRIDEVNDRPATLTPGSRVAVMFHDEDGELVATRLSADADQAEWMAYASPDRLPDTASPLFLLLLGGGILAAGGAAMRASRVQR
jgi:hypothetical protein